MKSVKNVVRRLLRPALEFKKYIELPQEARDEQKRDKKGISLEDPGIDATVNAALSWIELAQDNSKTADGGVARHYSLISGWGKSYPETTGYIIPTLLKCHDLMGIKRYRDRAKRMLDWLVTIQLLDGGFQGGTANQRDPEPAVFDTGQILLGLVAGIKHIGDERYGVAMNRAANWLVKVQDSDGCWRSFGAEKFVKPGEKSYNVHAAWGLLEAARIQNDKRWKNAALANIEWTLSNQQRNGWFSKCCLTDPDKPLSHTIGYVLRGIIEAYIYIHDSSILKAAELTATGLLSAIHNDGFLPGRLLPDWSGAVRWACLTGTAQISCCLLILYQLTKEENYREAAVLSNSYLRRTVRLNGPEETRGAIKGSFPINGEYGRFEYLNWAAKFFIDANLMEKTLLSF